MFSFPNDYQFLADSRCTGEPQIDVIVRLMALLQEAFGLECWTSGTPIPVTHEYISQRINKSLERKRPPGLNVPAVFTSASPNADVRIIVTTGARPQTPTDADSFNILFNGDFKKPDPKYWLQVIELLRPFMGDLGHSDNKYQVEPQERIHRNYPRKPSACLGLDYYTEPLLTNLGGKAHVLNTPAHRTSEFLDGVLIELVPGYYFDPNNPEHLRIQAAAMSYLGIDD